MHVHFQQNVEIIHVHVHFLFVGFQVINAYILIQNVDGVSPPPSKYIILTAIVDCCCIFIFSIIMYRFLEQFVYITLGCNVDISTDLVASVPRAGDDYNGQLIVYNTSTTLDNPIVTPATGSQVLQMCFLDNSILFVFNVASWSSGMILA